MADPRWRRDRNTVVFGIPDINTDTEFAAVWEAIDAVPIAERPRTRGVDPPQLFSLNGLTTAPKMHVFDYARGAGDFAFGSFTIDQNDVLGWGAGAIIALCSSANSDVVSLSATDTYVVSYHPSTGAVKRGEFTVSAFANGTDDADLFICDGVLVMTDPLVPYFRVGANGTTVTTGPFESHGCITELHVGADQYLVTGNGRVYDPSANAWLSDIPGPTGALGVGDSIVCGRSFMWCVENDILYKAAASLTPTWTASAVAPRPAFGLSLSTRAGLPAAVDPANGDLYYAYNTGTYPVVHRALAKIEYVADTESTTLNVFSSTGAIADGEPYYSGALLYPMQMYAQSGYVYFVGAIDSRSTSRSFPQTDESTVPPAARAAAVWCFKPGATAAARIDVTNTGAFPSLPPTWPPALAPIIDSTGGTDLDSYSIFAYGAVYPIGSRCYTWLGAKMYGIQYSNTDPPFNAWTTDVDVESWFRERRP